jgi:esterase/lipase superfamily enzyme
LKRALEVSEKALGPEHPQTVRATIQLAELHGLLGRRVEAEKLFLKVKATKSADIKEFPIFFGTNRKPNTNSKRAGEFGIEPDERLHLGAIKVLVPPPSTSDGLAKKESERPISDVRHLTIRSALPMSADKLVRSARERMSAARSYLGQALVFVHGFNNSFDCAVRRAAQLSHDLGFDGPMFVFSWPSREQLWGYEDDRERAQNSSEMLAQFLESVVAETRARRIHIIAHSMGNYALNDAFRTMDAGVLKKLNLGEIVMASPDLDIDQFKQAQRKLSPLGAAATIYAASSDRALSISSLLRFRKPRLGFIPAGGPKQVPAGADFIDVTAVNADVFSLNHDIYANSPDIIRDLGLILRNSQRPPDVRSSQLEKVPAQGTTYWRYRLPGSQ